MILQYLPIQNINVADDSFRTTFEPDISKLRCSIKTIGVIEPVHLRHTADGSYQIVSGYRRILACQELNRQTIPALIIEHNDLSPLQAFLHNLHNNVFSRALNVVEKATVVSKLHNMYGINEDDLTNSYLPLMDEPKSYKLLHQLLSIDNLIDSIKIHIVKTDISAANAARIAEFSPSTQQSIYNVLKHIRPNTNKLNELLTLIREISARDGISVEDVLHRYELLTIVANPDVAAPEKVSALRQTLKGIKLPELTKKQAEFGKLIDNLQLPNNANLKTDPYFENSRFKLEYKFEAPEELDMLVVQIKGALEKQQWHRIFDWYRS
jgi:ParB/RepB/Spo0J family partition protein